MIEAMYRICLHKGNLIEMQSGGYEPLDFSVDKEAYRASNLEMLVKNAVAAGYKEDEIEVRWVTPEEWTELWEKMSAPTPEQTAEAKIEQMIQNKMRRIAVEALQNEGKLPKDFNAGGV